ncbi:hypothetical protein BOSEA31B_20787 [Hyphomicrobiales bacterium]|nr:hypothetical protein BOSEA31B_20787 [Hyphomicrobiales bacterium]CAH1702716.1 hypothetical protein BOSEA1005_30588 [Hyphomicrobiales bacterium]CAI0346906.1 hypothetical protein BO1005MUT1_530082 [Hyphomicrobiales bacterium]
MSAHADLVRQAFPPEEDHTHAPRADRARSLQGFTNTIDIESHQTLPLPVSAYLARGDESQNRVGASSRRAVRP